MFASASPPDDVWTPPGFAAALGDYLVRQRQLDAKGLERARNLATESGNRLDTILTQLGLLSERALAEATAKLLDLELAAANQYPPSAILPERLRLKFLRKARAVPIALDDQTITIAMVDPLDGFTVSAIAMVAGREVTTRVAVPIELEAALDRLYPEGELDRRQADGELIPASAAPANDDDAEVLRDLASEGARHARDA